MPGTKNPTAPQSTNTTPAMQAYPTMTIPAEIAHQFTCRRGSEGIVTVISSLYHPDDARLRVAHQGRRSSRDDHTSRRSQARKDSASLALLNPSSITT